MFDQIHGLSCVENQLLAILKERGNDISPLYYNSAIPLKELFFFFVIKGDSPYRFYRIPRIQDELKDLGLIDMRLKRPKTIRTVREQIRRCKENEYVLLRVTTIFTKTVLHARGLRDDHYVRAVPDGNDFILYNDIPDVSVRLSARELGKSYAGEYFLIKVRGSIDQRISELLWNRRIFKAEKHVPFYFRAGDFEAAPNSTLGLRNMIGVYKTMRRRLALYYGLWVNTQFIQNSIPAIDQCYAMAEYYNLRKTATDQKLFELLYQLNTKEVVMMDTLKQKMEELLCETGSIIF